MGLIIECSGGHKMSVPDDYVGKRVRCPQCQEVITVRGQGAAPGGPPAPPAPPSPENLARHIQPPGSPSVPSRPPGRVSHDRDWEDRDRDYDRGRDYDHDRDHDRGSRRDRDHDRDYGDRGMSADEADQLRTVSSGLIFIGVRHLLFMCAILCTTIGTTFPLLFEEVIRSRRPMEVFIVLTVVCVILSGLLLLMAIIFGLIGSGMSCRAPARSGAKGLVTGSMICEGIYAFSILLVVLLAIIAGSMRGGDGEFLGFLALGVSIIGSICFITAQILQHLFLSRLANYVQDQRLAGAAMVNMVMWLIFFVGGIVIGVTIMIILAASRARGETAAVIGLILMWTFTLLMVLVYSLLSGIVGRLRRRILADLRDYR